MFHKKIVKKKERKSYHNGKDKDVCAEHMQVEWLSQVHILLLLDLHHKTS